MIRCPNCNAELSFNVASQLVTCEYCSSTFNPHELDVESKKSQELTYEGKSYLCSQCGAELLTFDETAITFCSYCGSQAMIESKMIKHNNPDFIIPFKKSKEECILAYKNKVSKFIFAPKYIKEDIIINKFRGIYIPYCIYKMSFNDINCNIGKKYSFSDSDYKYYDKYELKTYIDAKYEGISFDLISNFYDKFNQNIMYNYIELEQFNPNYLLGFYADARDININLYDDYIKKILKYNSTKHLLKRKCYKKYGCLNPTVDFNIDEKKIGMFPVYFLAIRNKKNDSVNYAIVNGQTGEIIADLPVDFKKYILISIFSAIPIFLLTNNYFLILPKYICFFSLLISIFTLILSIYQMKKNYIHENHLDDIGYTNKLLNKNEVVDVKQIKIFRKNFNYYLLWLSFFLLIISLIVPSLNKEYYVSIFGSLFCFEILINLIKHIATKYSINLKYKEKSKKSVITLKKSDVLKYTYKPILAICLGVMFVLGDFVNDIYYYGASFLSMSLIIWSFFDLVKSYNLLASRKLPQIQKRGGDKFE